MELLHCPFCGKPGFVVERNIGTTLYYVGCGNAECRVGPQIKGYDQDELMAIWNTRNGAVASTDSQPHKVPVTNGISVSGTSDPHHQWGM